MISAGLLLSAFSCQQKESTTKADILDGTYRLVGSETVKGTDTIRTTIDPAKTEMIKMFNDSHFAFLNHDKSKGKGQPEIIFQRCRNLPVKGKGVYRKPGVLQLQRMGRQTVSLYTGKTYRYINPDRRRRYSGIGDKTKDKRGLRKSKITHTYSKI